ncbi:DEAD/DEAH box helicase family protein, partial [Vibrio parahaemolyticus V-223/04]
VTHSFSYQKQ